MNLADQTWIFIRDALACGEPVVAILPCGATEAHGPHLPLGTDVIISEGIAGRAKGFLKERGIAALLLPSIAYAPADFAASFAGTITISAAVAKSLMLDIARSLKQQGFASLAIVNSHFDPANVSMLREAASEIRAQGMLVAFPDFTRRALAEKLTEEFKSGACHAGQFETSLVMAARPDLVDNAARVTLESNPVSLVDAIARGAQTFDEAGGPRASFGDPRMVSSDAGERSFERMAQLLVADICRYLGT